MDFKIDPLDPENDPLEQKIDPLNQELTRICVKIIRNQDQDLRSIQSGIRGFLALDDL